MDDLRHCTALVKEVKRNINHVLVLPCTVIYMFFPTVSENGGFLEEKRSKRRRIISISRGYYIFGRSDILTVIY